MQERHLASKEILFREGDAGDHAYILRSGRIEILKHAEHGAVSLAILEPGAVLGEMALFEQGTPRSASARALSDSTLEVLSQETFQGFIEQCPPQILPFLTSLMMRLRDLNARVVARERATVRLDAAINHVTLRPGSPALQDAFEPMTIHVANFPFSIGGYARGAEPGHQRLNLPCDEQSPLISPFHCNLERHGDEIFVVDQGSRFGTIMNGQPLGRGKTAFKAPINAGENDLILGGIGSPYRLLIEGF